MPVVEDVAQALGSTYRGRCAGTLGRVGIYSFSHNKVMTTSAGGMLISDDAALVARARHLATQAREPGADRAGQVAGEQAVRGHQQAGAPQGVEQGKRVVDADLDGRRLGQHGALTAGAVEQIEQVCGAGVGQLQ
ncbi:dTDP-4-amino-4,6-dideoxygalactose transaminase [Micromonospora noduli]|nr:dTDP-4-amino-4,6-dideoxygalactose transaminase [Micromonospora noduli]